MRDHYGKGWNVLAGLKPNEAASRAPILIRTFAGQHGLRHVAHVFRPGRFHWSRCHDALVVIFTAGAKGTEESAAMTYRMSQPESGDDQTAVPKSIDSLRPAQPAKKVAKPPKPRKVERRRRGRKS